MKNLSKQAIEGRGSDWNAVSCSTEFFHSGNDKEDVVCLLDMALDLVETWDVKSSPYNQRLKRCWMKRAQELGANRSW